MSLLRCCKTGYAAWQDLAGVSNIAGQDLNIGTCELERVLLALFLGCHKRAKEGTLNLHGKKKKVCEDCLGGP